MVGKSDNPTMPEIGQKPKRRARRIAESRVDKLSENAALSSVSLDAADESLPSIEVEYLEENETKHKEVENISKKRRTKRIPLINERESKQEEVLPEALSPIANQETNQLQVEIEELVLTETKQSIFSDDSAFHIKTTVHEEIMEFDLSDPIADPVSVQGEVEDTISDHSVVEDQSAANQTACEPIETHSSEAVEIETITANPKKSYRLDDDSFIIVEEELTIEEPDVEIQPDTEIASVEAEVLPATEEVPTGMLPEVQAEETHIEDEFKIEIGEHLHDLEKSADKINRLMIEEQGFKVEVDTSKEHITLINNSQDYMKYQHCIMDNRCISVFWPTNVHNTEGFRISISTEKGKTFIIDLDKIEINLLSVLLNAQRPIKVLHNAKPVIRWCFENNLKISRIFDLTTALSILRDGGSTDTDIISLVNSYSNGKFESNIDFQGFVFISKFLLAFRKKLVDIFQELDTMDVLNLEQRVLFALAQSELNGMPYNQAAPNPMAQSIWELVESKYGVSSKKELAKTGILSFNKAYLNERNDLLEVREFINAENSEKIRQGFDTKHVTDERIYSALEYGTAAGILTRDYSFAGEGLYSFISPPNDFCLVEGEFKNLEIRVIAKLLNNSKLLQSFNSDEGPYAYFATVLFDKNFEDINLDEEFKARMILETIVRELGERETLYYIWNTYQSYMKEDEIKSLKEEFKKVHPELVSLINETREQAQKNGYITTSTGRISIVKNDTKPFFTKVEMYMNDIFKKALELFLQDLELYNADYSPKIKLCTLYNRIITLECEKKIVNIAIDMLTRNMTRAAKKTLRSTPVLLKVYGTEQWEC